LQNFSLSKKKLQNFSHKSIVHQHKTLSGIHYMILKIQYENICKLL